MTLINDRTLNWIKTDLPYRSDGELFTILNHEFVGSSLRDSPSEQSKRILGIVAVALGTLLVLPIAVFMATGLYCKACKWIIELDRGMSIEGKVDKIAKERFSTGREPISPSKRPRAPNGSGGGAKPPVPTPLPPLNPSQMRRENHLKQSSGESNIDYWIRIKGLDLGEEDTKACIEFATGLSTAKTPYIEALFQIFRGQLTKRMGLNHPSEQTYADLIGQRTHRLVCHFLKEKCGVQKKLSQELVLQGKVLCKGAGFDPHFHMNTFYVDEYPQVKFILPNFDLAYPYFNPTKSECRWNSKREGSQEKTCVSIVNRALQLDDAPQVVEVQTFQPGMIRNWFHNVTDRFKILDGHLPGSAPSPGCQFGCDRCGLETEGYSSVTHFLARAAQNNSVLRIHMGETVVPEHGRDHIDQLLEEAKNYKGSKPVRIGHGTHMSIEAMKTIADRGYYVEACLSSNKRTGVVGKRSEYPLGLMLAMGVKVVIGTDGGSLYSTSLSREYAYALRVLKKFKDKMEESDEVVQLPSNQCLQYKHIQHCLEPNFKGLNLEQKVTYKNLKRALTKEAVGRISGKQLTDNVNELFGKCYP